MPLRVHCRTCGTYKYRSGIFEYSIKFLLASGKSFASIGRTCARTHIDARVYIYKSDSNNWRVRGVHIRRGFNYRNTRRTYASDHRLLTVSAASWWCARGVVRGVCCGRARGCSNHKQLDGTVCLLWLINVYFDERATIVGSTRKSINIFLYGVL